MKLFLVAGILIALFCFNSFENDDHLNVDQDSFSEYSRIIPGSDVYIDMVPVEGGTFLMGSPEDEQGRSADEGPQREVTVDPFWMGKYEISWNQYDLFANEVINELEQQLAATDRELNITADALSTPTPPYVDMSFGMGRDGFPAISMTHYAAVMFTKWLSAKTGEFYRLPTEAEWEYACRAGSQSAYHFGDDTSDIDRYVWYNENSNRSYNRVGTKEPNAFGLHDMSGNIAEWTTDQYYEDYFERLEGNPAVNPYFKPDQLYPRSVRGGSWQDGADDQRCAKRRGSHENWKMLDPQMPKSLWWHTSAPFVGFRVVRPKETPSREEMEEYWIEAMEDY
jgi:formylglycine-generating enzyme required for sulfatase activity